MAIPVSREVDRALRSADALDSSESSVSGSVSSVSLGLTRKAVGRFGVLGSNFESSGKKYGLVTFDQLARHLSGLGLGRTWLDREVRAGRLPCWESYQGYQFSELETGARYTLGKIRLFDPEAVMRVLRARARVDRKDLCKAEKGVSKSVTAERPVPIDASFVSSLPPTSPEGSDSDVQWVLSNLSDELLGFFPVWSSCPSRRAYNLLIAIESDPVLRTRFLGACLDYMVRGRPLLPVPVNRRTGRPVLRADVSPAADDGAGPDEATEQVEPAETELSAGELQTRRFREMLLGGRSVDEDESVGDEQED
jgi:hypothetical protein